jgi:hypothetical protein
VADTAIAADLLQTLDIHRYLTPQVSFYPVVPINHFTQSGYLWFSQISHPRIG